ncbi:MAG TPA: hypothetical protein VHW23_05510, partial [Kofleriaceae bacterium]|nr:hypothetical protein [Kofleriaceae bacterium]
MSIFDRLRTGTKAGPVELALPPVLAVAREAVERFEHAEIDAALLRAQLADRCRDAGVEPITREALDAQVRELDGEGWRRLAALAALWAPHDPGAALAAVLRQRGAGFAVGALVAVAREAVERFEH